MRQGIITSLLLTICCQVFAADSAWRIEEATISSVQDSIINKHATCEEVIEQYLDRIKQFNLTSIAKPPLNAIVMINPNVLSQARQLDRSYDQSGQLVGNLHCVPVVIKDNIDSFDFPSSSGSLALIGSQPNKDADVVARLRARGALIIAKTNMDEFADGMKGISSRVGRTGNVYDTTQNPGGSSGGSAVAVSANFAILGIGTDNSGSVRIPAAFNGVFALRPTQGLVSHEGIFPRGTIDGVAGPMARTVVDLALTFDAINTKGIKSIMTLKLDALQKQRIGVIRSVGKTSVFKCCDDAAQKIYSTALDQLEALGATIVDNVKLDDFDSNREWNMSGEVEDINQYLASFVSTRRDYNDICQSKRTTLFQGLAGCLRHGINNPKHGSPQYLAAKDLLASNQGSVVQLMDDQNLAALFLPITCHGIPTYDAHDVLTWQLAVASNAGLPSIVIILKEQRDDLPVGIQLIGRPGDDAKLIAMAYAYEQKFKPRITPTLKAETRLWLSAQPIQTLNNIYTMLGETSFRKVLSIKGDKGLSANEFRSILLDVLTPLAPKMSPAEVKSESSQT